MLGKIWKKLAFERKNLNLKWRRYEEIKNWKNREEDQRFGLRLKEVKRMNKEVLSSNGLAQFSRRIIHIINYFSFNRDLL